MTSVLNLSGLNYQNGNPLRRELQAIKTDIEGLRKEIAALKFFRPTTASAPVGAVATSAAPALSPSLLADIQALKNDIATIKAAGYGKGEKGDKGDKGDKGEPGQMAYIAMPPNMMMPQVTASAPAPVSAPAPAVSSAVEVSSA